MTIIEYSKDCLKYTITGELSEIIKGEFYVEIKIGKYIYPVAYYIIEDIANYEGMIVTADVENDSLNEEFIVVSVKEAESICGKNHRNDTLEHYQMSRSCWSFESLMKSQYESKTVTLWWNKYWDEVFETSIKGENYNKVILLKTAYDHYKEFCKRRKFNKEKRKDFKWLIEMFNYVKVYRDSKLNQDVVELEIKGGISLMDFYIEPFTMFNIMRQARYL